MTSITVGRNSNSVSVSENLWDFSVLTKSFCEPYLMGSEDTYLIYRCVYSAVYSYVYIFYHNWAKAKEMKPHTNK